MNINNSISYVPPQTLANCEENAKVLLAFSGGADSSALLHLLVNDSKSKGYSLHVAHFHHGIRGEEADRDARFCENTAKTYELPFHLGKADVPTLAKENGNSIEAEARARRYAFFERIMRENGISILATAHHAEDQTESILLHILRGSGISGLKGIQKCRSFADGLYIVRPLLEAKKCDILDYCHQNNIEFVTDSTNSDTNYLRNALRANVIPELYKLQPSFTEIFQRLSENATDADDFINASALDFLKKCSSNIPLEQFNSLHPALKSRVLSIFFEEKTGAMLERVHIEDVISLCQKANPHSSISLPNKISAKIENGTLIWENDDKSEKKFDFNVAFCEGEQRILDHTIITVEKNPVNTPSSDQIYLDIRCDLIDSDASFRSRKEGDVIFTDKLNKKVKKLVSEKKISLEMRKKVPVLVSNNRILWIPTVALCDDVKLNKINGEDFYRISIKFVK